METNTLQGKVVIVTGGNIGIGFGIIQAVAALGPDCIYLCARRKDKAEAAITKAASQYPRVQIRHLSLDLADLSSVRKCAEEFDKTASRLDLLFLNAGISSRKPGVTDDGYEVHFGVNYLGHILLTQLLMPKMLLTARTADVRVVALSSISGLLFPPPQGVDLDHMKNSQQEVAAISRYGQSKLAIILAMKQLAEQYPEICFASACPGNVKTDLWQQTDGLGWFTNTVLAPIVLWLTGISIEQAVRLPMWCALGSRDKASDKDCVHSGTFYHPTAGQAKDDNKYLHDDDLRRRLWKWTIEELKQHGSEDWPSAG